MIIAHITYSDSDSIKIELGEVKPVLSENSEYLRTLRKKSILRWDLNLKPNTVGENAAVVKYTYTMEYDRNMKIQPRRTSQ